MKLQPCPWFVDGTAWAHELDAVKVGNVNEEPGSAALGVVGENAVRADAVLGECEDDALKEVSCGGSLLWQSLGGNKTAMVVDGDMELVVSSFPIPGRFAAGTTGLESKIESAPAAVRDSHKTLPSKWTRSPGRPRR